MKIEIWSVGKKGESFIEEGIIYYQKRMNPFCSIDFVTIAPPQRSKTMSVAAMKQKEEQLILNRLKGRYHFILLDEKGKQLRSLQWADQLQQIRDNSIPLLIFLIGGPWGVTPQIRQSADEIWSLSSLTFPHQLARLIVAEQLYRAYSILHNSGYHHE